MPGAEASLVPGLISWVITIIDTCSQLYEAVEDEAGLPKNFKKSATKLPLILKLLDDEEMYVETVADDATKVALKRTLESCEVEATKLQEIFVSVLPKEGGSRRDRYLRAARKIGKGGRVEDLVGGILSDLQLMTTNFPEVTKSGRSKEELRKAVEEVSQMEPSLPEGFEQAIGFTHYGSGSQNINAGTGTQNVNNGSGQQYVGQTQNFGMHSTLQGTT